MNSVAHAAAATRNPEPPLCPALLRHHAVLPYDAPPPSAPGVCPRTNARKASSKQQNEPNSDSAPSRRAVRHPSSLALYVGSFAHHGPNRHKAIIAYLSSSNLPNAAAALRDELQIGDTFDAATSKKYEGLLEKKWTSIVRLQKKVRTQLVSATAVSRSTP